MQHDKSHKGRHVILVAGIALVSTVVVLSLPVIAAVPTMGIGVAPWLSLCLSLLDGVYLQDPLY